MNYCYILFSPSLKKFYTGITQESVASRLQKHNFHFYGNHHFTAKASDWELFLTIEVNSFSHARRIDLYIKRMKSSSFIRKLKENPEQLKTLIQRTMV